MFYSEKWYPSISARPVYRWAMPPGSCSASSTGSIPTAWCPPTTPWASQMTPSIPSSQKPARESTCRVPYSLIWSQQSSMKLSMLLKIIFETMSQCYVAGILNLYLLDNNVAWHKFCSERTWIYLTQRYFQFQNRNLSSALQPRTDDQWQRGRGQQLRSRSLHHWQGASWGRRGQDQGHGGQLQQPSGDDYDNLSLILELTIFTLQ